MPEHYDVASPERTLDPPEMQRLLKAIDAGTVDCVVYKVDRLSGSLPGQRQRTSLLCREQIRTGTRYWFYNFILLAMAIVFAVTVSSARVTV